MAGLAQVHHGGGGHSSGGHSSGDAGHSSGGGHSAGGDSHAGDHGDAGHSHDAGGHDAGHGSDAGHSSGDHGTGGHGDGHSTDGHGDDHGSHGAAWRAFQHTKKAYVGEIFRDDHSPFKKTPESRKQQHVACSQILELPAGNWFRCWFGLGGDFLWAVALPSSCSICFVFASRLDEETPIGAQSRWGLSAISTTTPQTANDSCSRGLGSWIPSIFL